MVSSPKILRIRRKKVYQKKNHKFRKLIEFFLIFVLVSFGIFLLALVYFVGDLPRPENFSEGNISQSTKIYDQSGKTLLFEVFGKERRIVVPFKEIPKYLKEAVIEAEDENFYHHRGLDFKAMARAILTDLRLGKPVEGASTISQQLIRNYFLTRQKTIKRKTREIVLTLELERKYSKNQILGWYLNLIPFGSNIYGVEAASEVFFHKHVSDISLSESAILAALIRSPSYLSPYGKNLKLLLQRRNWVLKRMENAHFIDEKEKKKAEMEKIKFYPNINPIKAPHFVMFVKNYLEKKYGKSFIENSGLKIYTTLNWPLQEVAQKAVKEGIIKDKIYNAYNGGLVAINPKTGEVLAMVGSKDWYGKSEQCSKTGCKFDPKVNITTALRQPGSSFKPFVYAAAFQKGFTPDTLIWDVKTEFNPNCSPQANQTTANNGLICYHPKNYDGRFDGLIKFKDALAQSRNVPSVKVLYLASVNNTLKLAKNLGITTLNNPQKYGLSLVLGSGEVNLLEMTSAYGVFARDGEKAPISFVSKIENSKGQIIFQQENNSIKVLSAEIAEKITAILSSNKLRSPMFGWNSYLHLDGYEVAAKTGTTENYRDAWLIGYTPSLSVGVWVGNNNNSQMNGPGVTLAGPIWKNFMEFALARLKKENFKTPKEKLTGNPILDGESNGLKPHCILYYLNKNNPLEKGNSQKDAQYQNWEWAVNNFAKNKK